VSILIGCMGCAGASTGARPRFDFSVLTHEQLDERNYQNVLEAVQTLRANWLNERGPDSFASPSRIWVYLDNTRMGGVQSLAQIPTRSISSVRRVSGIDATARWGIGHSAGVISVMTWDPHEEPEPSDATSKDPSSATADSTARRPQ
jgi:hypothetical protein